VLAHELWHFHHRHLIKRIAAISIISFGVLALGHLLTQAAFFTALGVTQSGTTMGCCCSL
jgi:STE24 endopeptidase